MSYLTKKSFQPFRQFKLLNMPIRDDSSATDFYYSHVEAENQSAA